MGWATSWGVAAEVVSAEGCVAPHPVDDPEQVIGGLHIPTDGLAKATRAVVALTLRAVGGLTTREIPEVTTTTRTLPASRGTRAFGPRRPGVRQTVALAVARDSER